MRKIWYAAFLMVCMSVVISCDDDDDIKVDEAWRVRNEAAFDLVRRNPEYKALPAPSLSDTLYYKVLEAGTGDVPLITSTVEVRYKGKLIDGTVFDMTSGFDTPETDDDLSYTFTLLNSDSPTSYTVIEGWGIALQHMHVGDRWEVYIPSNLGYGLRGYNSVPGASTLIFEIALDRIVTQTAL